MYSKTLGLDIGTNSVGSAWIDLKQHKIRMGVSVFPAGIEESDTKRGAPKNQARRTKRSQRRIIKRRAERKHRMRGFLRNRGWIPNTEEGEKKWLQQTNPWILRKEGLERKLTPFEFGRVLLHMAQRRGAYGFDVEEEDEDTGKIKEAISHTRQEMRKYSAETFGELMATKFEERKIPVEKTDKEGKKIEIRTAIRNRTKASGEGTYEFCADRNLISDEFDKLWNTQKSFSGELAAQLTDECRKELDNAEGDAAWRYKGILFGQRKTYWDMGTMARCDLEPTDRCVPIADMHAQYFRVIETVNNVRIRNETHQERSLTSDERDRVVHLLRGPLFKKSKRKMEPKKSASGTDIREVLGIKARDKSVELNIEKDEEREPNTDWFHREIVYGAIGLETWEGFDDHRRERINRIILKYDPNTPEHAEKLRREAIDWWGLSEDSVVKLIEVLKGRPKLEERLKLSRRAILNLLPYMNQFNSASGRWPTEQEAGKAFAEDAEAVDAISGKAPHDHTRRRYVSGALGTTCSARYYMKQEKHQIKCKDGTMLPPLPPAPMMPNPVVRKAIHEVRRHIQAYIRESGCKPDRVVVELAREARQSAKVRNKQLSDNREREKERKAIIHNPDFNLEGSTKNQQEKAIKRVLLCREQRQRCAYCEEEKDTISEKAAAEGTEVELDHIIPESRGGDSGMNNLVLCHTKCNRGKGNKTPREWLTQEQFGRLEKRLQHLKKTTKWDNLHKDAPDIDGFVESQLTDTAYASRQVVGWLRDVLYDGERDGVRRVFTTKGRYTSILRRDWGLFPDKKEGNTEGEQGKKNRADHRHHALDAVAIALSGPERLSQLAQAAEKQELAKSQGYEYPKRDPVRPAWGDFDSFRADVMKEWNNIVVAHRAERRRLRGELHKDEHFGAIEGDKKHFTKRIFAIELTPNHLRVPKGWEELRKRLENSASEAERRGVRSQMLAIEDVEPGKSGIVRDRWFREELRDCLRQKVDVAACEEKDKRMREAKMKEFTKKLKEIVKREGVFLKSGVPVRRITLLRTLAEPVEIKRKRFNALIGTIEEDVDTQSPRRRLRVYDSQNNHHIEIREDHGGKWMGEVITNFDADKRVRVKPPKPKPKGWSPPPPVNREDTDEGRFVMSLGIGEMVKLMLPEGKEPGYFVVFKIDKPDRIHFTPHWDAGRDKETEKCPKRQDICKSPSQLQKLGVDPHLPPQKVWVGPLGEEKVLDRD